MARKVDYRKPTEANIKRAQDMLVALRKREGLPKPDGTHLSRFADSFTMAARFGYIYSTMPDMDGLTEVEARVEDRMVCNAIEIDDTDYCSCGDCYDNGWRVTR